MRRFTILRSRLVSRINELPPTSPPPSAAYPFGFLSPASSSPEVHPAVGVMRVSASSSNVSAAHPHCFSTLRVSKLRASPSPLRRRLLSASRASALRWRSASVPSPGPVPWPGPHATSGVMFAESLRSSNRLTRSADTLAALASCRPFADLRSRDDLTPAIPGFFVTIARRVLPEHATMPNPCRHAPKPPAITPPSRPQGGLSEAKQPSERHRIAGVATSSRDTR